jgi:hypothetical protein
MTHQQRDIRVVDHPLFNRWKHIQQCFKYPGYKDYEYTKQLGLTCEWTTFWDFADDVETHLGLPPSPNHKLNRINQYKGWHLKNLQWALPAGVGRGQRHTYKIKYKGKTHTIQEWCDITGMNYWTLRRRVVAGMRPKDIFKI